LKPALRVSRFIVSLFCMGEGELAGQAKILARAFI